MPIETCDPVEALNKALCLEQEGEQFYSRAAARTVDPKGAAMFRSLADDERAHAQIIQSRMDALERGEEWVVPECVLACNPSLTEPLFPRGKAEFQKAVRSDASDLDALLFALKTENDAYHMYADQAQAANDLVTLRMYQYLADAERTHFDLLMLNYESLNQSAGWVD